MLSVDSRHLRGNKSITKNKVHPRWPEQFRWRRWVREASLLWCPSKSHTEPPWLHVANRLCVPTDDPNKFALVIACPGRCPATNCCPIKSLLGWWLSFRVELAYMMMRVTAEESWSDHKFLVPQRSNYSTSPEQSVCPPASQAKPSCLP